MRLCRGRPGNIIGEAQHGSFPGSCGLVIVSHVECSPFSQNPQRLFGKTDFSFGRQIMKRKQGYHLVECTCTEWKPSLQWSLNNRDIGNSTPRRSLLRLCDG